ncbi:hypothetical protein LX36DRAFT_384658 [Colletotrichum falcatum]|nr:hypothetical protein LX36DRAFT_384658 [Colletotrichum falcatum]
MEAEIRAARTSYDSAKARIRCICTGIPIAVYRETRVGRSGQSCGPAWQDALRSWELSCKSYRILHLGLILGILAAPTQGDTELTK